jgi:diadenosine tetraphosphate (Ap4A) HIT family hydrolase
VTEGCLFCGTEKFDFVAENELSYAIRDKYPVTKLHTLVISKKHYDHAFDLPADELTAMFKLAKLCREKIIKEDSAVQGFNFGTNSGEVAGQKINHVHFHLIPRRAGDIEPPPAVGDKCT